MSSETYPDRLRAERAEKDEFFGTHPRSPVPTGARNEFDGLSYYEPDPELRYELELEPAAEPERITVGTTADGEQVYDDVGAFRFTVAGESVSLRAFRPPDEPARLWLPFRDATSGDATYGAGRYLDLEEPDDRAGDRWIVDFNRAYNPFCAYADAYDCPLVPPENWLDVPIRAGEKDPDVGGY